MPEKLTLSYLVNDTHICLGLKKRGFGEGNWNGYGGKLEKGEDIVSAAVREIKEESEVDVRKENLEQIAIVEFLFEDGKHLEVHTFFTREWEGEPQETEEMRPKWFLFKDIPYEHMWEDDVHWLPRALCGEKLRGKIWFDESGVHIKKMEWGRVKTLAT